MKVVQENTKRLREWCKKNGVAIEKIGFGITKDHKAIAVLACENITEYRAWGSEFVIVNPFGKYILAGDDPIEEDRPLEKYEMTTDTYHNGSIIRMLRKEKGYPMYRVAEASKLSRNRYRDIEVNGSNMRLTTLLRVLRALEKRLMIV
jgi:hypothetical protein